MMKYISIVVFGAFLVWTWSVVHNAPDLSFETHSGIQERLADLIVDTVKSKKPQASDVVIEKIWTEQEDKNKVKAFFIYSFKDQTEEGTITSRIEGNGWLERQPNDGTEKDLWKLTKVQTNNDSIQFDEAMVITADSEASLAAPAAATSEPSK
jgi:hypothetical protein